MTRDDASKSRKAKAKVRRTTTQAIPADAVSILEKGTPQRRRCNLSPNDVASWHDFPVELHVMLEAVVGNRRAFARASAGRWSNPGGYKPKPADLERLRFLGEYVARTARSPDDSQLWDGVRRACLAILDADGLVPQYRAVLQHVTEAVDAWRKVYRENEEFSSGWRYTVRTLRERLKLVDRKFDKISVDDLQRLLQNCSDSKAGGRGKWSEKGLTAKIIGDCRALNAIDVANAKRTLLEATRTKRKGR